MGNAAEKLARMDGALLASFVMVPESMLQDVFTELERIRMLLEAERGAVDKSAEGDYVEPGPGSERQFFTPQEISERWDWGLTKVYELTEEELPRFKHGQLVRYFWAHVWALEGRMSRELAEKIWKSVNAVQDSEQSELPRRAAQLTRLR